MRWIFVVLLVVGVACWILGLDIDQRHYVKASAEIKSFFDTNNETRK